ncbi:phage tail tape measure C-terminal domain-containing protein [Gaopeijia maritima]|uniref:phage tail tape measure C-terminal domain-containing protein n=1 Tax=Gaopeijia maritima TaxID=3119007 RepID=UPI00324423CB
MDTTIALRGFASFGLYLVNLLSEGILRGLAAGLGAIDRTLLPKWAEGLLPTFGNLGERLFSSLADRAGENADEYGRIFGAFANAARENIGSAARTKIPPVNESSESTPLNLSGAGLGAPNPAILQGFSFGFALPAVEGLKEVTATARRAEEQLTRLQEQAIGFAGSFADALGDFALDGAGAFKRFADDAIRQLLRVAARFAVFKVLEKFLPGGSGIVAALGSSIGIEARAMGGPVSGGRPYLVGERGPELFVPGASGAIVPNGAVTINFDLSRLPRARGPRQSARDRDWLVFLAHSVRDLQEEGILAR